MACYSDCNNLVKFGVLQTSSDLLTLIQVMIMTFGDHPPVYSISSRPAPPMPQPNVPYPTTSSPYPTTPYPAMPMPVPGLPPTGYGATNTLPFSVRPSLITAVEEKIRRRLEDVYLSCEIVKKVCIIKSAKG